MGGPGSGRRPGIGQRQVSKRPATHPSPRVFLARVARRKSMHNVMRSLKASGNLGSRLLIMRIGKNSKSAYVPRFKK